MPTIYCRVCYPVSLSERHQEHLEKDKEGDGLFHLFTFNRDFVFRSRNTRKINGPESQLILWLT